jgi:hypothetical protein
MLHFASLRRRKETIFTARYRVVFYFFTIRCAWPDLPDERILLTEAESADDQKTVPARRM